MSRLLDVGSAVATPADSSSQQKLARVQFPKEATAQLEVMTGGAWLVVWLCGQDLVAADAVLEGLLSPHNLSAGWCCCFAVSYLNCFSTLLLLSVISLCRVSCMCDVVCHRCGWMRWMTSCLHCATSSYRQGARQQHTYTSLAL